MTKDQGQKPTHNDSGLQTDDERANSTELNANISNDVNICVFLPFEESAIKWICDFFFFFILQPTQKVNDGPKQNESKKENIALNGRNKTVCYDFIKGNCRRRFCRVS